MDDEEEFIDLRMPRQRTFAKPIVLRRPRSEDMRVVVEAEIKAVADVTIWIDFSVVADFERRLAALKRRSETLAEFARRYSSP